MLFSDLLNELAVAPKRIVIGGWEVDVGIQVVHVGLERGKLVAQEMQRDRNQVGKEEGDLQECPEEVAPELADVVKLLFVLLSYSKHHG